MTAVERVAPRESTSSLIGGAPLDKTEAWVSKLNTLARKLDEDASALHPSAWPEALKHDAERWKSLAKEGPMETKPVQSTLFGVGGYTHDPNHRRGPDPSH